MDYNCHYLARKADGLNYACGQMTYMLTQFIIFTPANR